jgi:hypothetical protein
MKRAEPQRSEIVQRDGRIGWSLLSGPDGERWVRDRDRYGWGHDVAYSRWKPADEAARLQSLARYEACADCWLRGDVKGMMLAFRGPAPLVVLEGGLDG